jgi:pantoate--beta-alanine ligase
LEEIVFWVEDQFKKEEELSLEYFNIAQENNLEEVSSLSSTNKSRAFIAVNAGNIRLIDNLSID